MPSVPACARRCSRPAFSGCRGRRRSASGSGCASCCRVPWPCWLSAPRHRQAWRQYPCRSNQFPGLAPACNTWRGWRKEQTIGGSFHRQQPAGSGGTSALIPKRVMRAMYRSRRIWRQKCRLFCCLQAVCGGPGYGGHPPVCDISGRSNNPSRPVLPAATKGVHGPAAQGKNCRPAGKAPGQHVLRRVVCPWLHAPAGIAGPVRRAVHGVCAGGQGIPNRGRHLGRRQAGGHFPRRVVAGGGCS